LPIITAISIVKIPVEREKQAHHTISIGKISSQGAAEAGFLPFTDVAFGLVSPIAFEIVSTTLLSAKISTGLFLTTSLQVGHVYTG
jgi:hypothetical protein